jgi:16S rRNA (adenine1518-N6/adenine1519-N6)-dimethyltransferase
MIPRIDVAGLLAAHGLRAKKSASQSFLHERGVLERIAALATRDRPSWVVEIGAGLGSLTAELARAGAHVAAIERDPRLVPVLESVFRDVPSISIVAGDATELRFASLVPAGVRPAVAGNLPYAITTPLVLALFAQRREIGAATIMVQREVALRLAAAPGGKEYGSLTVLLGLHADVRRELDVRPGSFLPPPQVHSSVLRIEWLAAPRSPIADEALFERVVRAAFGQRRKMLLNSLGARFPRDVAAAALESASIAPSRRAETLTGSEFASLANALHRVLPASSRASVAPEPADR